MNTNTASSLPIIHGGTAPHFELPGLHVVGLAAPSRGATETSVWVLTVEPRSAGAPHRVSREEIFVATSGCAVATVLDTEHRLAAGDALVVPAGHEFSLANPYDDPFAAVAVLPVGGQAAFPGGEPFTPPWAE